MALDQLITVDPYGIKLTPALVKLNLDKKIYLLHIFANDEVAKKKYIRNVLVIVGNQVLTSTFSDTVHFMEELYLFDIGNDQNKYLAIAEHKSTKNLKLKNSNEDIFVSKSEARAVYKLYNRIFSGFSDVELLITEYRLTPQELTKLLHILQMLDSKK